MAVSKVRKKTKGKPRGSIKHIPKVYSIKYKYIMGDYLYQRRMHQTY